MRGDDLAQPGGLGTGFGGAAALDDVMDGVGSNAQLAFAGERHLHQLLHPGGQRRRHAQHPARNLQPRRQSGLAFDLALRQCLVEAEMRIIEFFAYCGADCGVIGGEIGKGEGQGFECRRDGHERQGDRDLQPECAAIAGEQPGEIGAVEACRGRGCGVHQAAIREYDFDPSDALGRNAMAAAAMADRVLADAAAHRRRQPGKWPPEARAQAMHCQGIA